MGRRVNLFSKSKLLWENLKCSESEFEIKRKLNKLLPETGWSNYVQETFMYFYCGEIN